MKGHRSLAVLFPFLLVFLGYADDGSAASVKLRYGFKTGAVYRVTEQHHDVGKTVTEMNMMGQQGTMGQMTTNSPEAVAPNAAQAIQRRLQAMRGQASPYATRGIGGGGERGVNA